MAIDTIKSSAVLDGAIATADIADDAVTGAKIENNPTIAGNATISGSLSAKGGAVFNEDSNNVNLRVESNNDANMFVVDGTSDIVKIGSNAGAYGSLSIRTESAGGQERGLYIESAPASGTSPNNVAVFAAANANMTQPLVRIHHESPTADQLLLQATTTGSNTVKFSVDEDGDIYSAGGINLGGTGQANKLDDYEEGTFTPAITGLSLTTALGHYTKIGNVVHWGVQLGIPSTSASTHFKINNPPFANATNQFGGAVIYANHNVQDNPTVIVVSGEIQWYKNGSSFVTYADYSGKDVRASGAYLTS